MSIPLDNLYYWVESLLPVPAILYVFQPHGSKKISDCIWFSDYNKETAYRFPGIIAHDQEPLDWEFYNLPDQYLDVEWNKRDPVEKNDLEISRVEYYSKFNLKCVVFAQSSHLYDRVILIHSEKNSKDLEQYQQNGFLCVHYWAHAVIARDWYRFAEVDPRLQSSEVVPQNKFLIYCRDWSSRREYRLKFLELLVKNQLNEDSKISVMYTNSEGTHFSQCQFKNPNFELISPESIYQIPINQHSSSASADYDYFDFLNTQISVVLETVFDDNRIHLTEKTLRPIACGHPFILAAGPGSLEYVKSYGFKTFAPWIDESYDQETDSLKRLEKIIRSMKQIQNLQGQELENFSQAVKQIADFNKKHFFSNNFSDQVKNELKNNLDMAYTQVRETRGKHYLEHLKLLKIQGLVHHVPLRREKTQMLRKLRQSYLRNQSNPPQDSSV